VSIVAGAAVLIGIVGLVLLAMVWRGFVLSILWGWFMVPLGLPNISVALAIGIAGVVGMLTHQIQVSKDEEDGAKKFLAAFMIPLFALGVGWIVHQFA
jgi:hypothetical protein